MERVRQYTTRPRSLRPPHHSHNHSGSLHRDEMMNLYERGGGGGVVSEISKFSDFSRSQNSQIFQDLKILRFFMISKFSDFS